MNMTHIPDTSRGSASVRRCVQSDPAHSDGEEMDGALAGVAEELMRRGRRFYEHKFNPKGLLIPQNCAVVFIAHQSQLLPGIGDEAFLFWQKRQKVSACL